MSNGLGSPSCRPPQRRALLAYAEQNCATSGFVAAPAPTANYGFDVHIDTGALGMSGGLVPSVLQDAFLTPTWLALVWAAHAVMVMLEWGFSLETLGGAAVDEVGSALLYERAQLTWAWFPVALAVAAALFAYRGVVRRRVADTLGEAVAMGTMMVAGLWLVSDPAGTVGTLDRWSSEMSSGTLAAAAGGKPANVGTLADSLGRLFAVSIEAPWCYLEFGDVAWCQDPARLDRRLRAAAVAIALRQAVELACRDSAASCSGRSGGTRHALQESVTMLHRARSNGSIFLALPANGAARNSINLSSSLLRALCQSDNATGCRGPTASQAEFRTASGTWSRISGLVLIAGGLLGMLLLLGYVGLRLVTAASQSFVYLLMAPAIVLAPAFGDTGRALFRGWASHLLGALLTKLAFSFLLGILLLVTAVLTRLGSLGWWTQWLFLSAFWWSVFVRRRQLLALVRLPAGKRASFARPLAAGIGRSAGTLALSRYLARRDEAAASARARLGSATTRGNAPSSERGLSGPIDDDVLRMLQNDRRTAAEAKLTVPLRRAREADLSAQLERVEGARMRALAEGRRRRSLELASRRDRVKTELDAHQRDRGRAGQAAVRARPNRPLWRSSPTKAAVDERERYLSSQAWRGEARRQPRPHLARNYRALAPLAGFSELEYDALEPGDRRRARLEVDRKLRIRRARALELWPEAARMSEHRGQRGSAADPDAKEAAAEAGGLTPLDAHASQSAVMRDLWAVAAGHKRHLGIGRD